MVKKLSLGKVEEQFLYTAADYMNHFIRDIHWLSSAGIGYFDYHRYNRRDGTLQMFSNYPDFVFPFIEQHLYPTVTDHTRQENTGNNVVILSTHFNLPNGAADKHPEKYISNILLTSYFNIYHRIYFIFHHPDYIRVSGFAANKDDPTILEYYFNNLLKLQGFVETFEQQYAEELLKSTQMSAIKLPNFFDGEEDRKSFLYFKIHGQDIHFTEREFQCFHHRSKGLSAKAIAQLLNISNRTVEKNIENITNKVGPVTMHKVQTALRNWVISDDPYRR